MATFRVSHRQRAPNVTRFTRQIVQRCRLAVDDHVSQLRRFGELGDGQMPHYVGVHAVSAAGDVLVYVADADDRRLAGLDSPSQGVGYHCAGRARRAPAP